MPCINKSIPFHRADGADARHQLGWVWGKQNCKKQVCYLIKRHRLSEASKQDECSERLSWKQDAQALSVKTLEQLLTSRFQLTFCRPYV